MAELSKGRSTTGTGGFTDFEFVAKLPSRDLTAARDREEQKIADQYQKMLKQGYWFLWEGETAIPGMIFQSPVKDRDT